MQKNKVYLVLPLLVFLLNILNSKNDNGKYDRGYIVRVGDYVQDFPMLLSSNEVVTLNSFKGKVIVLQFTASWCSVCRKEMPYLEKYAWQRFKDDDFMLIGIDRDEPLDTVIKFKKDMKITYPLSLDPGAKIFSKFAEKDAGVTRNIVINKNGRIVFLTRLFEEKEFNKMIHVIEELLKEDS